MRAGRTVFISPHFDDAILSCHPLIRACMDEGGNPEVWTIMAGRPEQTKSCSGLALQLSQHDP